jgi:hypothetical protein
MNLDYVNHELTHVGLDKVTRYNWKMADQEGQFRKIHKRLLKVNNDVYQRDGIVSKVNELASNWSWIACGVLVVASRDGVFWVVDGQHRKLAADKRSDIQELPCMVFDVDEIKEEAQAFLATNTNRRNVSALDKFRAKLAAGDIIANKVQEAIHAAGLRVTSASIEPRAFKSVAQAQKIAAQDYDGLVAVLSLCGELARDENAPVHSRLLSGLYYIHRRIENGVDDARLRKRIKQIGARQLVAGANKAAAYYGHAGSKVCADGMIQEINHGLHNKFAMKEDFDCAS